VTPGAVRSGAVEDDTDPPEREAPPTMPSRRAFFLAFSAVVAGGVFGGIIGYGLVDIQSTDDNSGSRLLGGVIGAVVAAVGVGVVAVLVLRAMAEWRRR